MIKSHLYINGYTYMILKKSTLYNVSWSDGNNVVESYLNFILPILMTSIINHNIFHLILKFLVLPLEKWIILEETTWHTPSCIIQCYWAQYISEICSTLCPSNHSRTLTLPAIFLISIGSSKILIHNAPEEAYISCI